MCSSIGEDGGNKPVIASMLLKPNSTTRKEELSMKLRHGLAGLTVASVVALTAGANAADLYRAPAGGGYKDFSPPYAALNWSGFYAGVNGGGGWSESSDQLAYGADFGGLSPSGGFGGGQIGYNWQGGFGYAPLVLGIEADIQGAGIEDKGTDGTYTYKSSLDYFGTVRGRVGYAVDRALIYATGGFAYGGIRNEALAPAGFSTSTTATGYVLGGGVEYKVTPSWSLKGEYQYINLGKNDPTLAGASYSGDGGTVNDDAFHTFRVGLNYHVGSVYEPLK